MRVRSKSWANFACGALWLALAVAALVTQRVSRWGMTTSGGAAILFGLVCGIVGFIYLFGSFRIERSNEADRRAEKGNR